MTRQITGCIFRVYLYPGIKLDIFHKVAYIILYDKYIMHQDKRDCPSHHVYSICSVDVENGQMQHATGLMHLEYKIHNTHVMYKECQYKLSRIYHKSL